MDTFTNGPSFEISCQLFYICFEVSWEQVLKGVPSKVS